LNAIKKHLIKVFKALANAKSDKDREKVYSKPRMKRLTNYEKYLKKHKKDINTTKQIPRYLAFVRQEALKL
ncbi:hypothetical protein ACFLZH_04630, partial [Patescibacteria group bacterium]